MANKKDNHIFEGLNEPGYISINRAKVNSIRFEINCFLAIKVIKKIDLRGI